MVSVSICLGFLKIDMPMTLEILMSCMHQSDARLVDKSQITGDCVVINQCGYNNYAEYKSESGNIRMFSVQQRGLTRSRNLAIAKAQADVCMLCDDDEVFVPGYEQAILDAYEKLPQADVIIFKMINRPPSFPDQVMRLRFPKTMKVSSVQISFRRKKLLETGVRFDELLGAGTGNGAEEELKFLLDCQRAGLKIYYVPTEIAFVNQDVSSWFAGFNETFFENRGATSRYILGTALASLYAVYYVVRKKNMYCETISPKDALKATFRGIRENKITRQAARQKELEYSK